PPSRRDDRIDANGLLIALEREIAGDEDMEALYALRAESDKVMTRPEQATAGLEGRAGPGHPRQAGSDADHPLGALAPHTGAVVTPRRASGIFAIDAPA